VTRHFGVWRESDAGREKVFDPILDKGALSETGDLVIERSYRPVHAVGHLRYLECTDLTHEGRPDGELTPWGDIYFPYDPALLECSDLKRIGVERRMELASEHIVERYAYRRDGAVSVTIENQTRGYQRNFVLGQA
jgi:hypothetical protein